MTKFKFSHGLFTGLMLGLIISLFINTYAQSPPVGLYVEQLQPIPGSPVGMMKYSMYFETIQFQHHGETVEVDVHKLMNFLRTLK